MTDQEKIKDIQRIIDKLLLESYGQAIPNDVINYLKEYKEILTNRLRNYAEFEMNYDLDFESDPGRLDVVLKVDCTTNAFSEQEIKGSLKEFVRKEFQYFIKIKDYSQYVCFEHNGTVFARPMKEFMKMIDTASGEEYIHQENKFYDNITLAIKFDGRHTYLDTDFEDN